MLRKPFVLLVTGMLISVLCHAQATVDQIALPVKTSIRAIAAVNDSTVWFAGSNGYYGYSDDNGRTWHIDSIRVNTMKPDFRSISVTNDHTVFLLNAGSPAYLIRSIDTGKTWNTVYSSDSKDVFFDSMKFWDEKNGIAAGDPVNGCFTIIITHDGGETWQQTNCAKLPKPLEGEASFASSNTCLDVIKNNIWIATGGMHARVLHSADGGNSWSVGETPILQGEQMTGIFSLDFYDELHGIVAGGNYDHKEKTENTKAMTNDGGKTWRIVDDISIPGFVSCVQFKPASKAQVILLACLPGIYLSTDSGKEWTLLKNKSGGAPVESYFTFQFSPSGKVAWFAGKDGQIAKVTLK